MARGFSFGANGLNAVIGADGSVAAVARMPGEVAVASGNGLEMVMNPNYKPEFAAVTPPSAAPGMDL